MPSPVPAMTIRLSPEDRAIADSLGADLAPEGASPLGRNDVIRVALRRLRQQLDAKKKPVKNRER